MSKLTITTPMSTFNPRAGGSSKIQPLQITPLNGKISADSSCVLTSTSSISKIQNNNNSGGQLNGRPTFPAPAPNSNLAPNSNSAPNSNLNNSGAPNVSSNSHVTSTTGSTSDYVFQRATATAANKGGGEHGGKGIYYAESIDVSLHRPPKNRRHQSHSGVHGVNNTISSNATLNQFLDLSSVENELYGINSATEPTSNSAIISTAENVNDEDEDNNNNINSSQNNDKTSPVVNILLGTNTTASANAVPVKPWDVFKLLPPPAEYDFRKSFWADIALQLLKIVTYGVTLCTLLFTAAVAKASFLFMTSGIGWGGQNATLCGNLRSVGYYTNTTVMIENRHAVKWVWVAYLSLCMPEVICFIRCFHRVWFRSVKRPSPRQFLQVLSIESLHATGMGLLVFKVLPGLDAVTGAMLTNCVCFVPAILTMLSRKPSKLTVILVVLDIASIGAQSSGFWAWPVFIPSLAADAWAVPIAIFLISLAWWENFVQKESVFPFIRQMAESAENLKQVRSKTYIFVAPWKCVIYICCLFAFMSIRMSISELIESDPFGPKPIKVVIWRQGAVKPVVKPIVDVEPPKDPGEGFQSRFSERPLPSTTAKPEPEIIDPWATIDAGKTNLVQQTINETRFKRNLWYSRNNDFVIKPFYTTPYDALYVFIIQAVAAFLCYQCGKFACKVMMQRVAFALPINLCVPFIIAFLVSFCRQRKENSCYMTEILPYEMFWRCFGLTDAKQFFMSPQTWVWLIWIVSQFWITVHMWLPKCERLADTDRLFVLPWYSAILVEQGLSLNRRRDDKAKIKTEEIELDADDGGSSGFYETISNARTDAGSVHSEVSNGKPTTLPRNVDPAKSADSITKIYACATMWHETKQEMVCMLKSVFRLDEDQCARRNAQKYLKIVDPDYYEFEAHIFFDDAFIYNDYGEPMMNQYVRQLLEVINQAAGAVHQTEMVLKPPKKSATPYGGRIIWILPGRNKLSVHMKDKNKIKKRKRWSQVMYMYYLLGHRVMEKCGDDIKRKEIMAENTYILTLDGDVDFHPHAVHLLVDLMKKNRRLGAACGRIHPRGSGPMIWYQKFEYAIGHWFQKATEHMIGCVLCAPGCFSLFRSAALMDHNVLRQYATKAEKARECIQYDQGEDRWLCTLLLQRGYRVEYCAASDALTFAPQSFNEFFKQRKRWMPSTVANIIDLLADYRNVVKLNDSISVWYIGYQFAMLLSSILGPGTIFLMVVGAVNISFFFDTYWSLFVILIPCLFFMMVCFSCKLDTQHLVAQIISAFFALLMMAVIVGTALQIKKDGIYSPHAIFLFAVVLSFFIAAMLHPLEFTCIIPGILYFLAIPCTYMLLTIYSVCNLHTVSWGTRESATFADDEKKKQSKGKQVNIFENEPQENGEVDGLYSVGCGNTCRVLCCLQPSAVGNSPQMARLLEKVDHVTRKLDNWDKRSTHQNIRRGSSVGIADNRGICWENQSLLAEEEEPIDDNFDLPYHEIQREKAAQSESWLNDCYLRQADRDYIDPDEHSFWTDLIEKYLNPKEKYDKHTLHQKEEELKEDLRTLRNQVAFAFFMMNALFILIVVLLQTQKSCLYVEWPLGPSVNHSIIPCNAERNEEVWEVTRLQLEPIGFVFLIFFMSILLLQFVAMLMHRFGTMSHILASTELFCWRKSISKLSEDEIVVEHAVEIARELQAIRGIDEDSNCSQVDEADQTISRRRVIKNLENSRRSMMKKRTETLDAAFKKRFFALSSERQHLMNETPILGVPRRLTLRKGTIRALEHRRNSVFGTLDHSETNPYNADGKTTQGRGPARRRVDRLFHNKVGDQRDPGQAGTGPDGDDSRRQSSSEEDDLEMPSSAAAGNHGNQIASISGNMPGPNGNLPQHRPGNKIQPQDSWTEREAAAARPSNMMLMSRGNGLRKMISQNAWNGAEGLSTDPKNGLIQAECRQSSSSNESVPGHHDSAEARF